MAHQLSNSAYADMVQEWFKKQNLYLEKRTVKCGEDPAFCWTFTGRTKHGYGLVDVVIPGRSKSRTTIHAHRLALMIWITGSWDIPSELDASHLCGTRNCVRPDHLVLESREDNKSRQICHTSNVCIGHDPRPSCIFPPAH